MKEDIIAANLSSLRADIQALPQRISEELQRNNPETSTLSQKLDDDKLTELISQAVDVAFQSRLYDYEKYVDKILLVPLRNLPILKKLELAYSISYSVF